MRHGRIAARIASSGGDYGFAWNPHGPSARPLLFATCSASPRRRWSPPPRLGGESWVARGWPVKPAPRRPLLVDGDPSPTSSACRARTRCSCS